MKKDEARMERVLQGLREAEPANGLEQRVLRAIDERAARKTPPKSIGLWWVLPVATRWYAAAVLLLTVFLGLMVWQKRHRESGRDGAAIARQIEPADRLAAASPLLAAPRPVLHAQPGRAAEPRAKVPRVARVQQASVIAVLANHPAPEQPLTDEERLLLRIAHRGVPEEFEALNPDARNAQARADRAEFRKFFGPPPTGDSE